MVSSKSFSYKEGKDGSLHGRTRSAGSNDGPIGRGPKGSHREKQPIHRRWQRRSLYTKHIRAWRVPVHVPFRRTESGSRQRSQRGGKDSFHPYCRGQRPDTLVAGLKSGWQVAYELPTSVNKHKTAAFNRGVPGKPTVADNRSVEGPLP